MKISQETLNLLKWMSTINSGIKIEPGNKLYSKNDSSTLCAYAETKDIFENSLNTTNLPRFLSTISIIDDPEFEFTQDCIYIHDSQNKSKMTYYQSNVNLINQSNKVPKPRDDISLKFTLKSEHIKKILKSSSILGMSDITVSANKGDVYVSVLNRSTTTSDKCDVLVDKCPEDTEALFYFKKNNFKLIDEFDYDVEIYKVGLSKFSCLNSPYEKLEIFIVTNPVENQN